MLPQPDGDETPLVRVDFSDDAAWRLMRRALATPSEDGFIAYLHIVEDPACRDLAPARIAALSPRRERPRDRLVVMADRTSLASPEMPLLALRVGEQGRFDTLRVVARQLYSIENNLALANMAWEDFTGFADDDGVFRGFRSSTRQGRRAWSTSSP
ncbi:DUF6924 domain-containing protein [Streptomyces sp. NPDC088732]|uniref:DUF6924 domain-containing protein n=1 Tax=Streptomyces sp. NPDC088732 TaxID=3365879 RepID=UPI0037FF4C56